MVDTSLGNLPFVKLLLAKGAHTCVPDSKGQLLSNLQYEVNHYIEEARKSQIKKYLCYLINLNVS